MKRLFTGIANDLRYARRQFSRHLSLSLTAVLVLAAAIGAANSVFSVLYQLLLKPPPYPAAERLYFIHNLFPKGQVPVAGVSGFDYAEIGRRKDTFAGAAAYYFNDLTMTGAGAARHVDAVNVSASFFDVMGVQPQIGRAISEADDKRNVPGVLVLSDAFWRGAFGANSAVLGRTIKLNNVPYSIIGVMPPSFRFPFPATQMWIPVALNPVQFTEMGRIEKWLRMIVRVAPDVTANRVDAALEQVGQSLNAKMPKFYPKDTGWRFTASQLSDEQTAGVRRWLYLAFGAVLCVLLIACSNVSGLLLIRTMARTGEFAIRGALGAGRFAIARQILVETGLLVFVAGCLGIVLGLWAVDLSNRYGPFAQSATLEPWTFAFAAILAAVSTGIAGLLPALISTRLPIEQGLRSGALRSTQRGNGWRNVLVMGQIAVAISLVFVATLLGRSFLKLLQTPTGIEATRVWSGAIDLPASSYSDNRAGDTRFFLPLMERIAVLPGVQSVSAATSIPFSPSGIWTSDLNLRNKETMNPRPQAQMAVALPRYFETMKIPLLRGRTFTENDRGGAPLVAIINEELAKRYFFGEDPIGKPIGAGGGQTPATIIGVVGNVQNTELGGPVRPQVYWPELQETSRSMYVVARTSGGDDLTSSVRAVVAGLDPTVALYDTASMSQRIEGTLHVRRYLAFLLTAFACVGMVLAAVGLYAALAHLVELRRREVGVRIALGAVPREITAMIFAHGGIVAGTGVLGGLTLAIVAERLVRSQLFGVGLDDPLTWATVLAVIAVCTLVAIWAPARRASRIDPMRALREE